MWKEKTKPASHTFAVVSSVVGSLFLNAVISPA